ncbi:hypothetical protein U9M48_010539 [Paspalum notatum var. saurae]|uniref:Uncharacterized protein n=1 Tax=Paspalum notatum var. saurae TaxID=547442 RepID=A0AAQ3SUC8_PASNO
MEDAVHGGLYMVSLFPSGHDIDRPVGSEAPIRCPESRQQCGRDTQPTRQSINHQIDAIAAATLQQLPALVIY